RQADHDADQVAAADDPGQTDHEQPARDAVGEDRHAPPFSLASIPCSRNSARITTSAPATSSAVATFSSGIAPPDRSAPLVPWPAKVVLRNAPEKTRPPSPSRTKPAAPAPCTISAGSGGSSGGSRTRPPAA